MTKEKFGVGSKKWSLEKQKGAKKKHGIGCSHKTNCVYGSQHTHHKGGNNQKKKEKPPETWGQKLPGFWKGKGGGGGHPVLWGGHKGGAMNANKQPRCRGVVGGKPESIQQHQKKKPKTKRPGNKKRKWSQNENGTNDSQGAKKGGKNQGERKQGRTTKKNLARGCGKKGHTQKNNKPKKRMNSLHEGFNRVGGGGSKEQGYPPRTHDGVPGSGAVPRKTPREEPMSNQKKRNVGGGG